MKLRFLIVLFTICAVYINGVFAQVHKDGEHDLETKLQEIQRAIEEHDAHWTAGMTQMFTLSSEEQERMCGCADSISEEKIPASRQLMRYAWQPEKFDWRDKDGGNWMSPVKNQGHCGSCVAFGTIGTLEGQLNIYHNDPDLDLDLSEQHIFSCGGGTCDEGMYTYDAFQYLQDHGAPDEDCFPYTSGAYGQDQPCDSTCPDWQDRVIKTSCWGWVGGDDEVRTPAEIKEQLLLGPIATSMTVYKDFDAYTGGIYEHVWGEELAGHCVVFVGWDDTTDPPCWIIRNSWGMWGEAGHFRIRMGTNEVGIEARSLFLFVGDVPKGVVSDVGYNYGKVGIGGSKDWETSILNEGTASLTISSIYPNQPDFLVSSPSFFPQTVLPSGSLDITITFSPVALGSRQGRMTILSNSCRDLPELKLRGTGVIWYIHPAPSAIEDTLLEGEVKTVSLTLTNTADTTLTFTLTILREWLSVEPDSGVLEAGGDIILDVTLDATSLTPGQEARTNILIDTDVPDDERVVVPVILNIEATIITVSVPSSARPVNDTFDVGIDIDNWTHYQMPIAEVAMLLGFDPFLLEVQSVSATLRTESMSNLVWSVSEPGELNLTISDTENNTIAPGTGAIAELSFSILGGTGCGDTAQLIFLDAALTDTSGDSLKVEIDDGPIVFLCRGDVDLNGTVNIIDVLAVVNHILEIVLLEGEALMRADCNDNEIVNILDAMGIVNDILGIGGCEP